MENIFLPGQTNNEDRRPVIKVIGIGGAGGNAVSHMIRKELRNVEFVALNTDIKALKNCLAQYKVQLGERGTGAGTRPEFGAELANGAREAITDILKGTDMLFIAAGMGGGTGTGAAPVVAQVAKDLGILSVAVVTKPFNDEGKTKMKYAEEGLEQLANTVNSLIVVHNEKLITELPDDPTLIECFAAADDVLYNAVSGVSDIIHEEGYLQVDFEDVRTIMNGAGESMMGSAYAEGNDRARKASEKAIKSPLLEGVELSNAKGALVYIAASAKSLKRSEWTTVLQEIKKYTAEDAIIKAGVVFNESLGDKMKVTVLVTGFGRQKMYGTNSNIRSERVSTTIPREDAQGNRINNPLLNLNNSQKDEGINIPTLNSPFAKTTTIQNVLPSVLRGRTRTNTEENEAGNADNTQNIFAGLIAGSETATVTNGDLSRLQIPPFMRNQVGGEGK